MLAASITAGGPAERSGLREGDVIIGFAASQVGGIDDLQRLLTAERVGQRTEVTLLRGTEKVTLEVVPESRPPRPS